MILEVGESRICYETNPSIWTSEYYRYCVRLLVSALSLVDKPVNIILGTTHHDFCNANKTLRLDMQTEHTLVKPGGRDSEGALLGDVDLLDEDGTYLIRIPNYEYYAGLDATIEYSLPNIANMGSNDKYLDYLETAAYVSPMIYDSPDFTTGERTATITMFSGNPCHRRHVFAQQSGPLGLTNIQGVFSKKDLRRVYQQTKIMVNVHQTDHHHTFEELRVLPALCNGVVIVSENVPLKHKIPYASSIVWCSYGDLARTVASVQHNYKLYFKQIFTSYLKEHLRQLHKHNIEGFADLIRQIA